MAGPGLPTNVDSTYADDPNDPSTQAHQAHHDAIHKIVDGLDTTIPTAPDGRVLVSSGNVFAPQRPWDSKTSMPQVGDWLFMAAPNTNIFQPPVNTAYGGPVTMPAATWDQVLPNIDTAGSAGALGRLVAYYDNNGRPGAVLWDSGTFDVSTSGRKSIAASPAFTTTYGPVWWFAGTQGSATTACKWTVRTANHQNFVWSGSDTNGPVAYYSGTAFTWGISLSGAPTANPTTSNQSLSGMVRLAFRRSA